MIEDRDDTFLARWLNDELTEEELKEFQSSPEYIHFQKIKLGTEAIRSESFDIETMLARVKEVREQRREKTRVLPLWTYGVAASIVLLIGFFFFFSRDKTMSTGYGEQLSFYLPDSSEVILNANSTVTFSKRNWEESRQLSLSGEAYFKVKKGSVFTVATAMGQVEVLGTQFNVRASGGLFDVVCYEGKVKVVQDEGEDVLLPGKGYRAINRAPQPYDVSVGDLPGWMTGESTFRSMPLRFVLEALEDQYDISFEGELKDDQLLYTGSFPHDNLKVALKLVLGSLQIEYTIEGNMVILGSRS